MTQPTADEGRWADRDAFEAAVTAWAARIGVEPKTISFRHMSTKWASCSPSQRLTFSVELLDEPRSFGEAVIVHELLHLLVPNHGRLFQSLLGAYCPDWRSVMNDRAVCGALR